MYNIYMTKYLKPTKQQLKEAIDASSNIKQVLLFLNRPVNNGGYQTIRKWATEYGLSLPVLDKVAQYKGNLVNFTPMPDEKFFVEGTARNHVSIKKRMLARGIKDECVWCGLGPIWNDKPITLQIDHINGNRHDNRFENVRIMCPNCHTQTETFGNKGNYAVE